ncbi:MAG: DUF5615 family PIN-like protein, partial [Opitutales bacterium]|nr:DUF5615 family PIN-like protein [Opitutales bacterium]
EKIWYFAAREGYTIVTKDDDFHQRALTLGGPPKIIWINTPNMRRAETEQFFRSKREQIIDFENRKESLLVLSG